MAEGSGSSAILGVVIGALIVVAVIFFAFGGLDAFRGDGGGGDVDVKIEAPSAPAPAGN